MMAEKLKIDACKFCGGPGRLEMPAWPIEADCADAYVRCEDCDAQGGTVMIDMDHHGKADWPDLEAEAVAAWNRRPSPSSPPEGVRETQDQGSPQDPGHQPCADAGPYPRSLERIATAYYDGFCDGIMRQPWEAAADFAAVMGQAYARTGERPKPFIPVTGPGPEDAQ